MRILHTSDWHLGRSFHRVDLLAAQAAVVDHLVDVVRAERVAREVSRSDEHGGEERRTAWDCLVRVVRR